MENQRRCPRRAGALGSDAGLGAAHTRPRCGMAPKPGWPVGGAAPPAVVSSLREREVGTTDAARGSLELSLVRSFGPVCCPLSGTPCCGLSHRCSSLSAALGTSLGAGLRGEDIHIQRVVWGRACAQFAGCPPGTATWGSEPWGAHGHPRLPRRAGTDSDLHVPLTICSLP